MRLGNFMRTSSQQLLSTFTIFERAKIGINREICYKTGFIFKIFVKKQADEISSAC